MYTSLFRTPFLCKNMRLKCFILTSYSSKFRGNYISQARGVNLLLSDFRHNFSKIPAAGDWRFQVHPKMKRQNLNNLCWRNAGVFFQAFQSHHIAKARYGIFSHSVAPSSSRHSCCREPVLKTSLTADQCWIQLFSKCICLQIWQTG